MNINKNKIIFLLLADGAASRPAENDNMGKYKDLWDTPHVSPSGMWPFF